MIKETVQTVARWVDGIVEGDNSIEITGISFDTRKINKGNLFIPSIY